MTQIIHQPSFRRTRIAPTPSGFLHLGNIFSFGLTIALAKKYNASVLLRIDDMDRERANEKYIRDIFETLEFMEIKWQEGPKDIKEFQSAYSQQHRRGLYIEALQQLRAERRVFACECSRARVLSIRADGSYPGTCLNKNIPLDKPGVSWRLVTDNKPVEIKTLDGTLSMPQPLSQQYFVVRRNNKLPAYQLTSLMDDLFFDVDLIIRGEDLLDSSLAQLQLGSFLGKKDFLQTTFHHHPLLTDTNGIKLSKSAGATSIQYLRKQGKSPAEIFQMISDIDFTPRSFTQSR